MAWPTVRKPRRGVQAANLWLPALLILLAAGTHILGSSGWPVWTDEGWTAWATANPDPGGIIEILAADRHPPLYFVLLGLWRALAGESRLGLRLLSVFSGILSTALVYRLGRDTFDARTGRFAAALFAALPVAIYFTQAARHYSLLVLLACASTVLLRRVWRDPSRRYLIAYSLSAALLLYTHYQAVLLLGIHALTSLLLWRRGDSTFRDLLRLMIALAVAGLLFIPWAIVILQSQGLGEIARASTGAPGTYTSTPTDLLALGGVLFGGQLALLGGAFVLGAWAIVERRRWQVRVPDAVLILLSGGGLLILMTAGNLLTGLLTDRTTVILTPFLMLGAGVGLARLPVRAGRVLASTAVLMMLITPVVIQPSLPLDAVAAALAADYSPGDLIVLETGWDDRSTAYELAQALPQEADATILPTLPWVSHVGAGQAALPFVQPTLEDAARVWVVQWFQAPSVLPYLDDPASGFTRAITHSISTGADYAARYPDHPTITAALFEHLDTENAADVTFGDLFTLDYALLPDMITPGSGSGPALHVDLWWSALDVPALDYSAGVFLLDETGAVLAQMDGPPGGTPTTAWQPGARYFDRHTLDVPADLPPGDYNIGVTVYWYGDGVPLEITNGPLETAAGSLVTVGRVQRPAR